MTDPTTLTKRLHTAYVALQAAVNKLVKYEARGEPFVERCKELQQEMLLRRQAYCALLDEVRELAKDD